MTLVSKWRQIAALTAIGLMMIVAKDGCNMEADPVTVWSMTSVR